MMVRVAAVMSVIPEAWATPVTSTVSSPSTTKSSMTSMVKSAAPKVWPAWMVTSKSSTGLKSSTSAWPFPP